VRVVGLGAGGHAKVVVAILQAAGGHDVLGLLDPRPELHDTEVLGIRVLGGDELLAGLRSEGARGAFLGAGALRDTALRRRLFSLMLDNDLQPISAVDPKAIVHPDARLGAGATVMCAAVVQPGATLGDAVIVNTGAIVEHDCTLADHVHVATGATLAGGVEVGAGTVIGAGATVLPGVKLGAEVTIGAGAVVTRDVADGATVVGVPARNLHARYGK
jgi:UDP-perosamine 4-acetyltransferase